MADSQTNTEALNDLVKLLVDAFNDVESSFGSGKSGLSFADYGNLLTDVMHLAGQVKDLPAELKALDAEQIAQLISTVEKELNFPTEKARAIVEQIVGMVSNLLTTTLGQAEKLAAAIRG